ncbi:Ig-like domain-containing protein [Erwinia sp. HDF1-3R]|uniref:Ig-like domain-containing protein n=1 Tax=Erwinia sp. HDF1-3R TaxID=3141543 RepID=UPI0031F5047E
MSTSEQSREKNASPAESAQSAQQRLATSPSISGTDSITPDIAQVSASESVTPDTAPVSASESVTPDTAPVSASESVTSDTASVSASESVTSDTASVSASESITPVSAGHATLSDAQATPVSGLTPANAAAATEGATVASDKTVGEVAAFALAAASGPTVKVNPFTGDRVLSSEEKHSAQILDGTSTHLDPGTTLTVGLNGNTWTTTVNSDGSWRVEIPSEVLLSLPAGQAVLSVSFANAVGGTSSANQRITVEASLPPEATPAPHPTIDTPFGDGWLNFGEFHSDQLLTGTAGSVSAGQHVVLTINGTTFPAEVDNAGNWSLQVRLDDMDDRFNPGENEISVKATDMWGQTGSTTASFMFDITAPSLKIDTMAGDNMIDSSEINDPLIVSGTTDASEAGRTVTLIFNQQTWTTTVEEDGRWHFEFAPAVIQAIDDGHYGMKFSLSDQAGNQTTAYTSLELYGSDETLPTLTVDPISHDDALNIYEGQFGIEITGTSSHLPSGTDIEITLNGKVYEGRVGAADGTWMAYINGDTLAALHDGKYTLNFSTLDPNGNGASATRDVWLITHSSSEPHFTVNDLTNSDVSQHDGATWVTVNGTVQSEFPIIGASLNVGDYMLYGLNFGENGQWSAEVNINDLNTHGLNTMLFTVADIARNSFESVHQVSADIDTSTTNSVTAYEALEGNGDEVNAASAALADQDEKGGEPVAHNSITALLSTLTGTPVTAVSGAKHEVTSEQHALAGKPGLHEAAPLAHASADEGAKVDLTTVRLTGDPQAEGGIWATPADRTLGVQAADASHHAPLVSENTLGDLLNQHTFQAYVV